MDYTSGMLGEDNPMLGTGSSTNHYSSTASIDNERLMARIAELERDNQVLHERARQATSPSSTPMYVPPPTVNVSYPNPPPRLGIFTGQKPRGGGELEYNEWRTRCHQYLAENETTDPNELTRKIKASLKGIALAHVKSVLNPRTILRKLDSLFGSLLNEEDKYARFVKMQHDKKEGAAAYFSRLWQSFISLNSDDTYSPNQANSKIYHTFMSNLSASDNLLLVELRTKFGNPGDCSPECSDVLAFLRSYQERAGAKTVVHAAAASTGPLAANVVQTIDYDKLASLVVEKMNVNTSRPLPGSSHGASRYPPPPPPSASRRGPDFSLPCLNCGEFGHWRSSCMNPSNPDKVKASRQSPRYPTGSRLNSK